MRRAAAHIGPVECDGHGFVGTDINLLFRMLDARPLRAALAGCGAELGLIVSDYVYRNGAAAYVACMPRACGILGNTATPISG